LFNKRRRQTMQISYLADHPEFIPVLAPPIVEHWRALLPEETLERRILKLQKHANKDTLPIGWVAHADGRVFGTAALRVHDLEGREDLRACFKIGRGPAARDFGHGQGGEFRASPQRAVRSEPTPARGKRPAARRVFGQKAAWLRCSSLTDPWRVCSLVAPRHPAFCPKTGPLRILKQALTPWLGGVFVLPEHRRRGVASALCRAAEEKAWSLGFKALYLFTPDQQSLYARLGWKKAERAVWRGLESDIMIKTKPIDESLKPTASVSTFFG
jgi:GNAT superfamily N-acetyltransferase